MLDTTRPVLLDLFCGAGGASMGYYRAGFEVVGVDINHQPRYPFRFIRADAMTFDLTGFDAIHASPPCQAYSVTRSLNGGRHTLDLVVPVRARLQAAKVPYMIENVVGSPVYRTVQLCGGMFGLRTYRHRRFECSHLIMEPYHPRHIAATAPTGKALRPAYREGKHISVAGHCGTFHAKETMGIDWMIGRELAQAIPPAYTKWLGKILLGIVRPC